MRHVRHMRHMRHGSVRLRLTLLFGGLFLAAGRALLGIPYGLVTHGTSGTLIARQTAGPGTPATAVPAGTAMLQDPPQLRAQALQYAGAARNAENDALLLYSGI